MTADVQRLGETPDGSAVHKVRLGGADGLSVELLDFGATLAAIHAPAASGPPIQVLLGYDDLQGWLDDRNYHGRVVGRVANRIAGARFDLDGETYRLTANQGPNTLHGGAVGWGGRPWRIEDASAERAILAYVSPDGDEGFPGEVRARVAFRLLGGDTLEIAWEARAERPTPVAMTHHPYFNLTGRPRTPVLDHTLQVAAQAVLPVRPGLIPTGETLEVERTPFDLRSPRRLGDVLAMQHPQLVIPRGYDLTWVLDPDRGEAPAAVLRAPETGLELHLSTDQPGLQVYSGQGLGHPFAPQGAVALEPQDFPNAVNTPAFPSVILRPGERYLRRARYRFLAGAPG
ncbi:MAG: galactose mutarotase [Caulobacteraceae bacterium]|nr:galactose mutarotase [Caulobacter sp.]